MRFSVGGMFGAQWRGGGLGRRWAVQNGPRRCINAGDLPDVSNIFADEAASPVRPFLCMGLFSIFWSGAWLAQP
jgi:hypothetical protein